MPAAKSYPVIAEGHSDLEQIAGTVNGLPPRAPTCSTRSTSCSSRKNREEIVATLASIREHGRGDQKTAQSAERVAGSADAAATEASATLRDLSRAAAALERAANVSVHELRATTQELRSSAEIVARTADRLENPRALIFGPDPAQLGPGEKLR